MEQGLKKLSTSLYLNEDGNLALVQLTNGNWVVIAKDGRKIVYGPDRYFSSAETYLKIMDKEGEHEVSKKSS
jgi:hypothetical protein